MERGERGKNYPYLFYPRMKREEKKEMG